MVALEPNYSKHIKAAAVEWRLLVLDGELTPDEQQALDVWLSEDVRHAKAYEDAALIWDALGTISSESLAPAMTDRRAHGVVQRMLAAFRAGYIQQHRAAVFATVAVIGVSLLLLALLAWDRYPADTVPLMATAYDTKKGETRSVVLSDLTAVTLGAGSALRVTMSDTERRVALDRGAAVFNVHPNPERPFIVEAQSLNIRVTGTVFDVRNNGDVVRLSVAEGVVEASHPWSAHAATDLLTQREVSAGQRVTATKDQGLSNVESFRVQGFATWRDDRLRYSGATLKELIADANRYSEREIILGGLTPELENTRVTVSFSGDDIEGLLATLPDMFAVELADADDGSILIRDKAQ